MSQPGQTPGPGGEHGGMGPRPQGPSFDAPDPGRWGPPPPPGPRPFPPAAPVARPSSDQFRPPKDNKPLWIVGIVVAVVLLVVATATLVAWRSDVRQRDQPTSAPTVPSAMPTPAGNGIDFVSLDSTGRLDVLETTWTTTGLQVKLGLTVTTGKLQYGLYNFQAFDEQGTLFESSTHEVPQPALGAGYLTEGDHVEGWLGFQVSRQDVTLLLISEYGKAITAYKIDG